MGFPAFGCIQPNAEVTRLLTEKKYQEAQDLSLERLSANREEPMQYLELAVVYGARAMLEETDPSRREQVKLPQSRNAAAREYDRYFKKQTYDVLFLNKAIETQDRVIEKWPGFKQGWLCKIDLLQAVGRDDEMLATIDDMLAVYQGNKLMILPDLIPFVQTMINNLETERSARYFQHLLKHYPDSIPLLTSYAFLRLTAGDIDEAIANYQKAYEAKPESDQALKNLTLAYILKQDFASARQTLELMLKLRPENTPVYFQMAILAMTESDEASIAAWDRYFEQNEEYPDDEEWVTSATNIRDSLVNGFNDKEKLVLAQAFSMRGLNQYAIPVLVALQNKHPDNHVYAVTLAQAYENSKLPEKAYEYGKLAASIVEQDPDKHNNDTRAGLHFENGRIAMDLGRLEESRASFEKVLELDPVRSNLQYMLGKVNAGLGSTEIAIDYFDQCVKKKNNMRFLVECESFASELRKRQQQNNQKK